MVEKLLLIYCKEKVLNRSVKLVQFMFEHDIHVIVSTWINMVWVGFHGILVLIHFLNVDMGITRTMLINYINKEILII